MSSNHSSSGYSKWSDAARERWEDFWSSRGAIERVLLVLEDNTDCIPWGSAEDFLRKQQQDPPRRRVTVKRRPAHREAAHAPVERPRYERVPDNTRAPRAELVSVAVNEAPAHVEAAPEVPVESSPVESTRSERPSRRRPPARRKASRFF